MEPAAEESGKPDAFARITTLGAATSRPTAKRENDENQMLPTERGAPVLGDRLYGGRPAPRLMLHASELTLAHPHSGRSLTLTMAAS